MASKKQALDPAAAALSAIEEALRLANTPGAPEPSAETPSPETAAFEAAYDAMAAANTKGAQRNIYLRLPEIDDPSHMPAPSGPTNVAPQPAPPVRPQGQARPQRSRAAENPIAPIGQPANDDRHSVGQLLQALNTKPSRKPYILATLATAGWLGLCGAYLFTNWTPPSPLTLHALAAQPEIVLGALLAGAPPILFFVIAALARRVQEIRQSARSMTEVALRLAEPETMATEQVVSLSQAIRREVAAMGDGIERALARAGEFETMVRSEVSNLERSYGDNERRMRALIESLASEREAIQTNADRVRSAVTSVRDNLSGELQTIGAELAERVS